MVYRKLLLLFLIILVMSLLAASCLEDKFNTDDEEPVINGDVKVAAYIRSWELPEGGHWNADMIKGQYLSDIIIAFAIIDVKAGGTSVYIPEVRSGSFKLWDEVSRLKAKFPHLKVNFSVGGGSDDGLAGYSDMAANPSMRAAFSANVCKWLEDYNMDGVDIDWEYPVGPSWWSVRHPEDKDNYISLLRDLRGAMNALGAKTGKYYSLSTAVPASTWFVQANDVIAASEYIDGFKLMSYDYYGFWNSRTGHNAALYRNPSDPENWSTDQAVKVYLDAGVPAEKLIMGVAFYGQAWRGVASGNNANGLYQASAGFLDTFAWSDIKKNFLNSYKRYWDNIAKAPYLYNGDIWISYTDHDQIRALTDYVKEKKLGGYFVWEYGQDMNTELLKTLAACSLTE